MRNHIYSLVAMCLLGACLPCAAQDGAREQAGVPEVTWRRTGPIEGGFVNCLARTPAGHILAGTSGGLYRSTDGGDHWSIFGERLRDRAVNQLAVTPQGHIFAWSLRALMRSTDAGATWKAILCPQGANIGPDGVNSKGWIFAFSRDDRVYRSVDGGGAWPSFNQGLDGGKTQCLAVGAKDYVYVGTDEGLFRSTDGGRRWTRVGHDKLRGSVSGLAVDPSGGVVARTPNGLFRSSDNGKSWVRCGRSVGAECIAATKSGRVFAGDWSRGLRRLSEAGTGWTDVLATDVGVPDILTAPDGRIYIATKGCGVLRSTDDGEHWEKVNAGLTAASIYSIAFSQSGQVFAGGSGVWRSSDTGKSWQELGGGLPVSFFMSLAINQSGHIFAGTLSGRIFRSTDNGDHWAEATGDVKGGIRVVAVGPGGHLFAGGRQGIFRSTDNGEHWTKTNVRAEDVEVESIAFSPAGRILAGTEPCYVLVSDDGGDNWTQVEKSRFETHRSGRILGLAAAPDGRIYLAGQGPGVLVSEDGGDTWKKSKGRCYVVLFQLSNPRS